MNQIKRGDSGLSVRVLQYLLGLKVTGVFDDATDKTVRVFQEEYDLVVDGIFGIKSWTKLAELQKTEQRKTMLYGTNPVRAIQIIVGLVGSAVDGKFGLQTENAVKAYQLKNGLKSDGIFGVLSWTKALTGSLIQKVVAVQPKNFKQFDSRWRLVMYSKSNPKLTIANNGCGPTAMANIIATWWNAHITPVEVAALAVRFGYCAEGSGTYRSFFKFVADRYGCSKFIRTTDTNIVKKALMEGAYVVALMGKGYFTGGGHYITLWKYDPSTNLIYVNDPASWVRTKATATTFANERKEYFIFYK